MHKVFYKKMLEAALPVQVNQPTRLIGIRHGQTSWNAQGLLQGQEDIPLTTKGRMQAKLIAELLATHEPAIAALYSSDLQRAYNTAEAISFLTNKQIITTQLLRERHAGIGQGMSFEEYDRIYKPVEEHLNSRFASYPERGEYTELPGGETFNQVAARTYKALGEIIAAHPGKTIVFVTHARVLSTLIRSLEGELKQPLDNCCAVEFLYDPTHSQLLTLKSIRNLEDKPHVHATGF